jgi:iron complex outermembrane receptor protein
MLLRNKLSGFATCFLWIGITFDLHPSSLKGFSFTNSFSTVYGFNRKKAYKNEGLEGEYLPLIPPAKLLSSIARAIPTKSKLFQNVNVKIEAENYGAQNRYLGLENTETPTAGYTLVNISFNTSIRVFKESPIAFQVEANNLLNKAYQSNLSRLKYFEYYNQSPNGHLGIYNMGRNISVKAIVSF